MPTIYIDCSMTCKLPINTGIQRVVRNIARHAPEIAAHLGYSVKLVNIQEGEFSEISINHFQTTKIEAIGRQQAGLVALLKMMSFVDRLRYKLASFSTAPAWRDFIYAPHYRFGLAKFVLFPLGPLLRLRNARAARQYSRLWSDMANLSGDILLLADSTWEFDIWPIAMRFKQQGGYIAAVIYDLIPISHPQFCVASLTDVFTRWIKQSIHCADFYICISRSTESTLKKFLRDANGTGQTGYFHLGSDLDLTRKDGDSSVKVARIVSGSDPNFLVVGSLEPRKNLAFVLDAFERIWQQGSSAKLILVGHHTWKVEDLIARIQQHRLLGTSLFWVRDASDTDLEYLYQRSTALVFASMVEGFGLPIVEAMQRGLPVLCSDIPVFREIADGKASFFSLDTTDELVHAIRSAMEEHATLLQPRRIPHPWLSWSESTDILLNKIHAQYLIDRKNQSAETRLESSTQDVS